MNKYQAVIIGFGKAGKTLGKVRISGEILLG